MRSLQVLLATLSVALMMVTSKSEGKTILLDQFTEESFKDWVTSDWKGSENMGKWDISSGDWNGGKFICREST